jgi:TP901 family phage tail tape measure protein
MAVVGNIAIGASVNVGGLTKGLKKGEMSLGAFSSAATSMGKTLMALGPAFGAVAAASSAFNGLKASVGTAISLEKSMTGLAKASDLSGTGLEIMKGQLFGLSTELKGVPLDDIMGIATNLSKMGVANDQLVEQTRGIAMLTTAIDDLPADQVADQIGKLNSVFKLGGQGALQMGSALDKIADSGLSSASGILDVAGRIGGTTKAMRIGAGETMAMAAALLDTGTSAEQAASTINNMLMNMVAVGNHADFAKTAGVSAAQFGDLVASKPMKAVESFLVGLGKLDAAGQLAALSSAGITAQERQAAMQKMAQQTGKLAEYVAQAAHEFKTLDQITASYNATAKTTDALWIQFHNRTEVLSDTLGGTLLPAINSVLGAFGSDLDKANSSAKALIDTINSVSSGKASGGGMGLGKFITHAAKYAGPAAAPLAAVGHFMGGDVATKTATSAKPAIPNAPGAAKKAAGVAAQMMNAGLDTAAESKAGGALSKLKDEVGDFEKELKLSIATWGMTSRQVDLYKLSLAGASAEQLRSAQYSDFVLTALERERVAKEELVTATKKYQDEQTDMMQARKDEAASLFESTRTETEKYAAEMEKLQGLLATGDITKDTFNRAKAGMDKDMMGSQDRGPRFAGAMEMGSSEAISAINQFRAGSGGDNSIKDVAKESKAQTKLLQEIANNSRGNSNPNGASVPIMNF